MVKTHLHSGNRYSFLCSSFVWRQNGALRFSAHQLRLVRFFILRTYGVVGKFTPIGGIEKMADFEKMYYELFNGITDTIEKLKERQQTAEELYIEQKEEK